MARGNDGLLALAVDELERNGVAASTADPSLLAALETAPVLGKGGFSTVYGVGDQAIRSLSIDTLFAYAQKHGTDVDPAEKTAALLRLSIRGIAFASRPEIRANQSILSPDQVYIDEDQQRMLTSFERYDRNGFTHMQELFSALHNTPWEEYLSHVRRGGEPYDTTRYGDILIGKVILPSLLALHELNLLGWFSRDYKLSNILTSGPLEKPSRVVLSDIDQSKIPPKIDGTPVDPLTRMLDEFSLLATTPAFVPDTVYAGATSLSEIPGLELDLCAAGRNLLHVIGAQDLGGAEGNLTTRLASRNQWRTHPQGYMIAATLGEKYRRLERIIWRTAETAPSLQYPSIAALAEDLTALVDGRPGDIGKGERMTYLRVRARHRRFEHPYEFTFRRRLRRNALIGIMALSVAVAGTSYVIDRTTLRHGASLMQEGTAGSAEAFTHAAVELIRDETAQHVVSFGTSSGFRYGVQEGDAATNYDGTTLVSGDFVKMLYLATRLSGYDSQLVDYLERYAAEQRITFADEYPDTQVPHNLARFSAGVMMSQDSTFASGAMRGRGGIQRNVGLAHIAATLALSLYDQRTGTFRNATQSSDTGTVTTSILREFRIAPFLCEVAESPYFPEVLSGDLGNLASTFPGLENVITSLRDADLDIHEWTATEYYTMLADNSLATLKHLTKRHRHNGVTTRKVFYKATLGIDGEVLSHDRRYDIEPGYGLSDEFQSEKSQELAGTIASLAQTLALIEGKVPAEKSAAVRIGLEELVGEYLIHADSTLIPPERWHIVGQAKREHTLPDYLAAARFAFGMMQDTRLDLSAYGTTHESVQQRALQALFTPAAYPGILDTVLDLKTGMLQRQAGERTTFYGNRTLGDALLLEVLAGINEKKEESGNDHGPF